jgi:hypothetical protein
MRPNTKASTGKINIPRPIGLKMLKMPHARQINPVTRSGGDSSDSKPVSA